MSLIEDRPSGSVDGPPRTSRANNGTGRPNGFGGVGRAVGRAVGVGLGVGGAAQLTAGRRPPALRELLLVASLWFAYSLGRHAADGRVSAAFGNASRVWDLQQLLHLPDEDALQELLLQSHAMVTAANCYYAFVHFPATAAFLLWIYLRRPDHYRRVRNTLALLTAAALAIHTLFPLAPPRMLAQTGMIDTGRLFGPTVYGSPDAGSSFTNQYAAMPSLHVGWAILLAVTIIGVTSGPWRWLWLAHPAITLAVVVSTANHYWVDGIVAGVILLAVGRATGLTWSAGRRAMGARRGARAARPDTG